MSLSLGGCGQAESQVSVNITLMSTRSVGFSRRGLSGLGILSRREPAPSGTVVFYVEVIDFRWHVAVSGATNDSL